MTQLSSEAITITDDDGPGNTVIEVRSSLCVPASHYRWHRDKLQELAEGQAAAVCARENVSNAETVAPGVDSRLPELRTGNGEHLLLSPIYVERLIPYIACKVQLRNGQQSSAGPRIRGGPWHLTNL